MFYPKYPIFKYPQVQSQLIKGNESSQDELLEWLVKVPLSTTYRVNLLKAPDIDSVTTEFREEIAKTYSLSPKIRTIPDVPELICIETVKSVCKIDDLNQKEVIIDVFCAASVLRGAHIYAPGVLAMMKGTKIDSLVNVFADLEGKCRKGTNVKYESPLRTFIGVGTVKMQREELYTPNPTKKGIAIEMLSTISGVPSIGDLSSSKALLQNFPSIITCRVLNPQSGDTVLDMCSSPGNKTTHIADLMQDQGIVIALDKTENKIKSVQQKIDDLQIKSVKAFAYDSTKALAINDEIGRKSVLDGPPFPPETFDKILLDAPCSALGNRPLLVCKLDSKMLRSFIPVQKKLFSNAVGLLKKGGVLVYSTCTVTVDENEGLIKWALEKFSNLTLQEAQPVFGHPGIEGVGLSEDERKLLQRFGPCDNGIDSVGFFIAKFAKC